jgi:hypothetical protein
MIKLISDKLFISGGTNPHNREKVHTTRIMEAVKPYFLSPYREGSPYDKQTRVIQGQRYSVERANHGLAHGLRQGALAKDIFNFLVQYLITDSTGIVEWARQKAKSDPFWLEKIQLAASFQRSGRQSECSSTHNLQLYKQYERQDVAHFNQYAQNCLLFAGDLERSIFGEAILWSNPGTLDENQVADLKYLRRIFHAAHTLDLRRIRGFDGERIQKEAMEQLFGGALPPESDTVIRLLWDRSGEYLKATGDRDLVNQRPFQASFFTQSHHPSTLVDAIHSVAQNAFFKRCPQPQLKSAL